MERENKYIHPKADIPLKFVAKNQSFTDIIRDKCHRSYKAWPEHYLNENSTVRDVSIKQLQFPDLHFYYNDDIIKIKQIRNTVKHKNGHINGTSVKSTTIFAPLTSEISTLMVV